MQVLVRAVVLVSATIALAAFFGMSIVVASIIGSTL